MVVAAVGPRRAAEEVREAIGIEIADAGESVAQERDIGELARRHRAAQSETAQGLLAVENDAPGEVPGAVDEKDLFLAGVSDRSAGEDVREAVAVDVAGRGDALSETSEASSAEKLDAEVAELAVREVRGNGRATVDEIDRAAPLEPFARNACADEEIVEAVTVDVARGRYRSSDTIPSRMPAGAIIAERAAEDESGNRFAEVGDRHLRGRIGVSEHEVDAATISESALGVIGERRGQHEVFEPIAVDVAGAIDESSQIQADLFRHDEGPSNAIALIGRGEMGEIQLLRELLRTEDEDYQAGALDSLPVRLGSTKDEIVVTVRIDVSDGRDVLIGTYRVDPSQAPVGVSQRDPDQVVKSQRPTLPSAAKDDEGVGVHFVLRVSQKHPVVIEAVAIEIADDDRPSANRCSTQDAQDPWGRRAHVDNLAYRGLRSGGDCGAADGEDQR